MESTHKYEVEAKPANSGWRVVKRPIGGGGGMVLAEYSEKATADALAVVLTAFMGKETDR